MDELYGPWAPVNGYDVSSTGGGNPFPTPIDAGGGMMDPNISKLMTALQGVKAPAAPQPMQPHMIQAPNPRAVVPTRGDQFMQLVQLLGNGGAAAANPIPATQPRLSQALGYR